MSDHQALVLKLSARKELDWDKRIDPLNREANGWKEGMSLQDVYDTNRGIWRIAAEKLAPCEYVLFCAYGQVRLIIKRTGHEIVRHPLTNIRHRVLEGDIVTEGDIHTKWFGADTPVFSTNARLFHGFISL
ncbi:hypothetical protein ACFVX6_17995 [Streptomyces sp. NPDC058289]|uniref:hypothetical protein n=1 Tax=Streptomyces sp. NPDC058289 TaxID=3346425 RepID=UPI0036EB496D